MSKKQKAHQNDNQVNELKMQLARALADYDNFQKRVEREQENIESLVTAKVILKLLPVIDMLYSAQEHLKDSGLALTIKELEETLKSEGVVKIKSERGDEFNEELHEAIEVTKDDELEDNKIVSEALKGWMFEDGPVIRHAKVVVNKK